MKTTVWLDALSSAMKFEYRRLASLRSTAVVLVSLALWSLIGGLSVGLQARFSGEVIDSNTIISAMTGAGQATSVPIAALLCSLLATFSVTDDWRTGQGVTTYLTTPQRSATVVSKALVMMGIAIPYCIFVTILGMALAAAIGGERVIQAIDSLALAGLLLGNSMTIFFWCCMAVSLGVLIRSSAAVIAILILGPLLGEILLAGVLVSAGVSRSVTQFFPFRSAGQLLLPDGGIINVAIDAIVVIVFALLAFALAIKAVARRDI